MRRNNSLAGTALYFLNFMMVGSALSAESASGSSPSKGNFFRVTAEVVYKGKPTTISYVAGCSLKSSRQIDGDRSVDGAAIVPMLWGERMPDGGAVVLQTPQVCGGQTTANGKVPPTFMPLIVHFENADEPWFGRAYMSDDAYDQPKSVMKFLSARIDDATGDDWDRWRKTDSPRNTVRYELTELTKDWFTRKEWKPGTRWMPMRCFYASILRVPSSVQGTLGGFWPRNRPLFWTSEGAYGAVMSAAGNQYAPSDSDALFEGRRFWDYSNGNVFGRARRNGNPPGWSKMYSRPIFPVRTDFDINRLDANGNFGPELDPDGRLTRRDVLHRHDERGFAYCQSYDSPKGLPSTLKREGEYRYNGVAITKAKDAMMSTTFGFVRDEYLITFGSFQLHTMGGAL